MRILWKGCEDWNGQKKRYRSGHSDMPWRNHCEEKSVVQYEVMTGSFSLSSDSPIIRWSCPQTVESCPSGKDEEQQFA